MEECKTIHAKIYQFTFKHLINGETNENSFEFTTNTARGNVNISWKVNYSLACSKKGLFELKKIELKVLDKLKTDDAVFVKILLNETLLAETVFSCKRNSISSNSPKIFKREGAYVCIELRFIREDQTIEKIIENYKKLLEIDKLTDVTFIVGNEKFKGHQEILAIQSPVFTNMFMNDWAEGVKNVVNVEGIEPKIFYHLINYCYFAEVDCDRVDIHLKILVAADRYLIKGLINLCENYISDNLSSDNVDDVFTVANLLQLSELIKKCENLKKC